MVTSAGDVNVLTELLYSGSDVMHSTCTGGKNSSFQGLGRMKRQTHFTFREQNRKDNPLRSTEHIYNRKETPILSRNEIFIFVSFRTLCRSEENAVHLLFNCPLTQMQEKTLRKEVVNDKGTGSISEKCCAQNCLPVCYPKIYRLRYKEL
jgi:hypothetical protein